MEKKRGCSTRSRCGNARECEYCATTRQMQIAGMAEALGEQWGQLTMTVIKPESNTAAAVKAVHASFMRRALAPAGIWTVETGELFGGLHLNILSPKPMAARWRGCETYSELLRTTARDAGAYIAKREGIPSAEQYPGRLYGSFGQIGEILATQERMPILQAAAIEVAMGGGKGAEVNPPLKLEGRTRETTKEERAEIMRRHLPNLYAAMGKRN